MVALRRKNLKKEKDSKHKAQEAARIALEKKAHDIAILDMRKSCDFCDYFVLLNADSQRQIEAVSDAIKEGMAKLHMPLRLKEGSSQSNWVLLDYKDIVIHIFNPEARKFYSLERIWEEARRVRLPTTAKHVPAKRRKNTRRSPSKSS